ncbi:DUF1801 domain-containing protein [Pelagibacterium halotolerans]|uniref:YdhG-like domain-containing protein n=1 Tax=Pelagibacterium halotolerans (strain DSM 22347 / JCM 15775 / CGMCC 1.7692 / B2) TaxID=1082931 RepID=G4RB95_PELHB|nr:DUF1801 domain-containing protein [Pelagibacterium halotolerans]AEQ51593.1 hypothetical protein KKY_1576 [Pelagibacterium halotolerans B2]QJR18577.1 DUF1801 domain-containing protein [Pelagibacterium halotolerans]SEA17718.1 protein of unknown function (DU1801) [Pelagibacterium halotolerans]
MSGLKTRPTDQKVSQFIDAVEPDQKRQDCWTMVEMMREITGSEPVMWGSSIVGFGTYTYVNTTKKPADWPITGFSPRKANLTLYVMPGFSQYDALMEKLGKHSTGVSCLYVKKLADIDLGILKELIRRSVEQMRATYPTR